MNVDAKGMHFRELNNFVREADELITIDHCSGQRFLASGMSHKKIVINGTPGNALGAYLDGCDVIVNGNAQDAVGDTMNDGLIAVHGSVGDALGYAMRGGKIYVQGKSGYRTGIHMKEYKEKKPVIIVGETAGSFLGEYMAGGIIIVLNLNGEAQAAGDYAGTGMHGGKIFIRGEHGLTRLPDQVSVSEANKEDLEEIKGYLLEYCRIFSLNYDTIMEKSFSMLKPNAKNPYKRLYTPN
ncbi:MAG: GltB/FmdC/FwdC-like GXGXG domain-containing protein [Christensenellales bacterium]